MGLFNLLKPKSQTFDFYISDYSKDLLPFRMTVHGSKDAEKNNLSFRGKSLSGLSISFQLKPDMVVILDGLFIGSVYEKEYCDLIENGMVDRISAEYHESDSRVHLYFSQKK